MQYKTLFFDTKDLYDICYSSENATISIPIASLRSGRSCGFEYVEERLMVSPVCTFRFGNLEGVAHDHGSSFFLLGTKSKSHMSFRYTDISSPTSQLCVCAPIRRIVAGRSNVYEEIGLSIFFTNDRAFAGTSKVLLLGVH